MSITRTPIHRGSILTAGYDKVHKILEIEFSSHRILQYEGVSPEIATRFLHSSSPESYYRDVIEEEFTKREVSHTLASKPTQSQAKKSRAALEALFG